MNIKEEYLKNGIVISGSPAKGFTVFTVLTQHFKIASLDELTNEKFEEAIEANEEKSTIEAIEALSEFTENFYNI
jgi:hypothetical protein